MTTQDKVRSKRPATARDARKAFGFSEAAAKKLRDRAMLILGGTAKKSAVDESAHAARG